MADTADKYADKVDPEITKALNTVAHCYCMLKLMEPDLTRLDRAETNAHSILHITDPTLYHDMINSKRFGSTMKMARAGLAFIRAMDAVKEEVSNG